MLKNPLLTLFNKIEEVKLRQKMRTDDLLFTTSKEETSDALADIALYAAEISYLEEHYTFVGNFITKMRDIQNNVIRKETLFTDNRYKYFTKNLKPWEYDVAVVGEICDCCGRSPNENRGLVVTLDPISYELLHICDDCHITRSRKAAQNQTPKEQE